MNLFLLDSILFYFLHNNRNKNIYLVVYYSNNFCYLYKFNQLEYSVPIHCKLLFNMCISTGSYKLYTYNACGSVTLLFMIINFCIPKTKICLNKLSCDRLFNNLACVIDIENIYKFCVDYIPDIVNVYSVIINFCCSLCSTKVILCLFKTDSILLFCNLFRKAINLFILKVSYIFKIFNLYSIDNWVFIINDIINFLNISITNIYRKIFKLFCPTNIFNSFFVTSVSIENFLHKLIKNFIGVNNLSLILSRKIFNLDASISFKLDNTYILNSGVRIKKTNIRYSYSNVLKIDFISFYSSIYISQYRSFFKTNTSSIVLLHCMTNIYNKKYITNEKIFKNFLNFFYGYFWNINLFGSTVCYIGEVIMSSFIYYLYNLGVSIIDCNVDHIVIKCNNFETSKLINICNKFLFKSNLVNFFKFSFLFSEKSFIADYNNSVMLSNNSIIGRGIFNYKKYLSLLDENTFNCVIKCYYCLELDLKNFNYLSCTYFFFIKDDLYFSYLNRYKLVKIDSDICTNSILESVISNIDIQLCDRLLNLFINDFDAKILNSICKYFLYNLYIFCLPVIFKLQPSSKINKILNFIRLSSFSLDYWIHICSEYIKLNMGFNICLAIYCKNLLCLDFDNYKFNNLNLILKNNFLCITSPRYGAKVVGVSRYNYRSKNCNLECISNKWISIYGNYVLNNYNGKYCFYINNNRLFNFDNLDIGLFSDFFVRVNTSKINKLISNTTQNKFFYLDFQNLFANILDKELKNINSCIHSTVLISKTNNITIIKFNIICAGHKNKNYQAFCFLKFDSLYGLFVDKFSFIINCSGSKCRVSYKDIRSNIIKFLKN